MVRYVEEDKLLWEALGLSHKFQNFYHHCNFMNFARGFESHRLFCPTCGVNAVFGGHWKGPLDAELVANLACQQPPDGTNNPFGGPLTESYLLASG